MKRFWVLVDMLIMVSILAACGSNVSNPSPTPDVNLLKTQAVGTAYAELTRSVPTATLTPTATFTPTITLTPTITQTSTATLTPTITLTPSMETNLAIYMINVDNQETCKYYTFPIVLNRGITGDMIQDTATSISFLLGTHWLESGILVNPLGTSSLQLVRIDYTGARMDIRLTGLMSRYDDECTNYEARDQLWATAMRFVPQNVVVAIWVDDLLFDDFMIGR